VVVRADGGVAGQQEAVQDLLADLGDGPHVAAVADPFQDPAASARTARRSSLTSASTSRTPSTCRSRQRADARNRRRGIHDGFQVALGGSRSCRPNRARSAPRASVWPPPRSSC
jgi:hypothetical protein